MKKPQQGVFIVIEGLDGSGKSTAARSLKARLAYHGYFVHASREPGGSPLSEKIRDLILSEKMTPLTEMLLFNASRHEHLAATILPHLAQRHVVISERFADSSYAYQGVGRMMENEAQQLEQMVVGTDRPDYTLYFRITVEESEKRLTNRSNFRTGQALDRLELETKEFKERALKGFESRSEKYVIIDAMQDIVDVTRAVCDWVDNVFVPNHPLTEE